MWILLTGLSGLTEASTVQRTNYGMIFQQQGKVFIGQENWVHTFEIRLPRKVSVPLFHQCPIKRSCYVLNALFSEMNSLKTQVATKVKYNTVNKTSRLKKCQFNQIKSIKTWSS